MNRVAFVFPGQGAQTPGMGLDLYESSPSARRVFDAAHEALKEEVPLRDLVFSGTKEDLALTANTQPAVLAVSVAAHAALLERAPKLRPALVAGHSVGEYSALVAAGALDLTDAMRVVRLRGKLMQRAVPDGEGTMAAVIGIESAQVERVCDGVSKQMGGIVASANLNSPLQTVISGHSRAVRAVSERLEEMGARKVIPLRVSAPFHSPLMEPVVPELGAILSEIEIRRPSVPLVSNVEAEPVEDPGRIRGLLIEQVTAPVRWVDVVRALVAEGVTDMVELGPGKVLCGLARGIDKTIRRHHIGSSKELESLDDIVGKAA